MSACVIDSKLPFYKTFVTHISEIWKYSHFNTLCVIFSLQIILAVVLASLTTGISFIWPAAAIPVLMENEENPITIDEGSYFSMIPGIALIISAPIFAYLVDAIGRKKTMTILSIPQFLSSAFTAYGGSIYIYYIARILTGIGDAGYFTAVPIYIAEITTPKIRGTWGNGLTFMCYCGNFLALVMVYHFDIRNSAYICGVVPIIQIIALQFLPESPYFLIMVGKCEEAYKALQWYRCKRDVDEEFKQLTLDVNRQISESATIKDLFVISSNRRAITIGAFLRAAQQFGGISAISIYAHLIFSKNFSTLSPSDASVIFMSLLVITNFFAAIILDKLGRRKAMIISCTGCSLLLSVQAVYFYLLELEMDLSSFNLVPVIGLSLYVLFYAIGIGIMPTLMLGELFSSSVKGKCLCLMNIFFGVFVAICTKIFQLLMTNFGIFVAFSFFTVTCFGSAIVSYFIIPETSGKTLEEIQQTFKK